MPEELKTNEQKTENGANTVLETAEIDAGQVALDAAADERKRINGIRKLGARVGADQKTIDKMIDEGVSLEKAVEDLIVFENSQMDAVGGTPNPSLKIAVDERDNFRNGATDSFMVASGMERDQKVHDDVRKSQFSGMGLQALAMECLSRSGATGVHRMNAEALWRKIVQFEGSHAQGTGDFTAVLANTLRKSAGIGWAQAPTTYQLWTKPGNLKDFKTAKIVKLTEFSDVETVREGEPRKMGKMADMYEQATLFTVGKNYSLTRESFINDDMNMLTGIPAKMMRSVRRYVNRHIYTNILYGTSFAGQTMLEDATALFASGHSNLVAAASGGAVAQSTVHTGVKAMLRQPLPSPDNSRSNTERLNIPPKFMICGPSQGINAFKLFNDIYYKVTGDDNAGNVSQNYFGPSGPRNMRVIEETLIDYLDTTYDPWYLAADPYEVDTVTVFTLNGKDAPETASEPSRVTEADGIMYMTRYDFCAAAIDWRGLYCNSGAASA